MIDFISLLPKEVIHHILVQCDPKDILHFAQTNHRYFVITSDDQLWKKLFSQAWPLTYPCILSSSMEWKKAYQVQTVKQKKCVRQARKKSLYLDVPGILFFSMHGKQKPVIYDPGFRVQYRRTDPASLSYARLVFPGSNREESSIISLDKFPQVSPSQLTQICWKANQIAIGMINGALYFFNEKGHLIRYYAEHQQKITDLCIHDNLLVSASLDGQIKTWDTSQAHSLTTLTDHQKGISSLASMSHLLISGSMDKTVRIWSLSQEKPLHATIDHSAEVTCVQSLDSYLFASANLEGLVSIYDGKTLQRVQTLQLEESLKDQPIKAMYWDTHLLMALTANKTLKIWDYNQAKCLSTIPIRDEYISAAGLYVQDEKIWMGHYSAPYLSEVSWEPSPLQICSTQIKSCYSHIKKFIRGN